MGFPAAVEQVALNFGRGFFLDAPGGLAGVAATATVQVVFPNGTDYIVWTATGDPFLPFPTSKGADTATLASVLVPRVDQAGWVDESGAAVTFWHYTITVTYSVGNNVKTVTKDVQPTAADMANGIDVELLHSGAPADPGVVELRYVHSVNGYTPDSTGNVTIPVGGGGGGNYPPGSGIPLTDMSQAAQAEIKKGADAKVVTDGLQDDLDDIADLEDRFGQASKSVSNSDLNTLYANGLYYGKNLTNAPGQSANSTFLVAVQQSSSPTDFIAIQDAIGVDGDLAYRSFRRYGFAADGAPSWQPWGETNTTIADGSITAAKLATAVRTSLGKADKSVQTVNGSTPDSSGNVTVQVSGGVADGSITYAKLDPNVKHSVDLTPALDTDNRLSATAGSSNNTDLNTLRLSGWWTGANMTNAPEGSSANFFIQIIQQSSAQTGNTYQRAYSAGRTWGRWYNNAVGAQVWSAWVEQANVGASVITRKGYYSFGGATNAGDFGTATAQSTRTRFRLTKNATRIRLHVRNYLGLSDYAPTGTGPTIQAAYVGRQDVATTRPWDYLVPPLQLTGAAATVQGLQEWVSDWITPNYDLSKFNSLLSVGFTFPSGSSNIVYGNGSHSINIDANVPSQVTVGTPSGSESSTQWYDYGYTALEMWLEYEYADDNKPVGLCIGHSLVDGTSFTNYAFWDGQVTGWPQQVARKSGQAVTVNAFATAKSSDWSATSTKWSSRFTDLKPDWILIDITGNDVANTTDTAATIDTRLRGVIAKAKITYPTAKVYVATCAPMKPGWTGTAANFTAREAVRQQVNANIGAIESYLVDGIVDIDAVLVGLRVATTATGTGTPAAAAYTSTPVYDTGDPRYFGADNQHPNPRGHARVSDLIHFA